MTRTVFQNANILDGVNAPRAGDVVVEGERIIGIYAIGEHRPAGKADVVYDLAGMTLMPGMVSGHSHLSYLGLDPIDLLASDMKYPGTYMAVAAAKNAETVLKAGFTSAVGAGGVHNIDCVLKQLINDGLAIGPRIVAGGLDFVPTGYPVDFRPEWWNTGPGPMGAICDGPDEFRKAVRKECKRGVEVIKIFPGGGHGVPTASTRMTYDEIATVVETAHLSNMRVRAHAAARETIAACLKAGVDIIDHGDEMDDEIIGVAVSQGAYILPSLYFPKASIGLFNTGEECEKWFDYARHSIAKGIQAGVKFVTGDDFGLSHMDHGTNARELLVYVEDIGIAPLEVIKWATSNAGEMTGLKVGRLAADYFADILVIAEDPTLDISVLADPSKILMVMKGGDIVSSNLPARVQGVLAEQATL